MKGGPPQPSCSRLSEAAREPANGTHPSSARDRKATASRTARHDDALTKAIRDEATARKGTNPEQGMVACVETLEARGGPIAQPRAVSPVRQVEPQASLGRGVSGGLPGGTAGRVPRMERGRPPTIDTDDTRPRNPQGTVARARPRLDRSDLQQPPRSRLRPVPGPSTMWSHVWSQPGVRRRLGAYTVPSDRRSVALGAMGSWACQRLCRGPGPRAAAIVAGKC